MTYLPELRRALVDAAAGLDRQAGPALEETPMTYLPELRSALVGAAAGSATPLELDPSAGRGDAGRSGAGLLSRWRELPFLGLLPNSSGGAFASAAIALAALAFLGVKVGLNGTQLAPQVTSEVPQPQTQEATSPPVPEAHGGGVPGAPGASNTGGGPQGPGTPSKVPAAGAGREASPRESVAKRAGKTAGAPRRHSASTRTPVPPRGGNRQARAPTTQPPTSPTRTKPARQAPTKRPTTKTAPTKAPKSSAAPTPAPTPSPAPAAGTPPAEPPTTTAPPTGAPTTGNEPPATTAPPNEAPAIEGPKKTPLPTPSPPREGPEMPNETPAAGGTTGGTANEAGEDIPEKVQTELLEDALRAASEGGEPHPSDIQAVRTTTREVGRLLGVLDTNLPEGAPVYFIAMRGEFRVGNPGGSTAGAGQAEGRAAVLTLEVPVEPHEFSAIARGWGETYPDLTTLGAPVEL